MPLPHDYGNLPEFDIILPAEDRFPERGRGLSGRRKVYSCEYSGVKKRPQERFSGKIAPKFWMI
jgi:hypothetical protein